MPRADHLPVENPCKLCGLDAADHRTKHAMRGNPCECGLPEENHRLRSRSTREREERTLYQRRRNKGRIRNFHYLGVDGEGQGRENHKYIFLGVSDSKGKRQWSVENQEGLSTEQCLDFFLSLPTTNTQAFSFAFNYDLTKILTDVDDKHLFFLFRPERRKRNGKEQVKGPKPILWKGYYLNLQGSKFWVRKKKKKFVIWDIFRFYGMKFTKSLADWKVGQHDTIALDTLDPSIAGSLRELMKQPDAKEIGVIPFMEFMKDQRAMFDKIPWSDVKTYCLRECQYIGELASKLDSAHDAIDLTLTSYYGAGSSATAMLKKMNIESALAPHPEKMNIAVAAAFFGGRFENSVIGSVPEKVYNYDISSAYPYQLCFLPCLVHGSWEETTLRGEMEKARNALVRYRLPVSPRTKTSWAPFPFRTRDGSIAFPSSSGGGYVWKEEFLAGERVFPNVVFESAWVYHSNCECQPFANIPSYYLERLLIGKEGPGIVIKLAMNSCYGKLAQSIGNAPFNNWVWAGLITSGCRAQILDLMSLHDDVSNLLMVATDGVYTRERLSCPLPRDTGTFHFPDGSVNSKPLGGWEEKTADKGVFVSRPGIYFPLRPTEKEIETVRGRGVGKKVIYDSWQVIIDAWNANPSEDTSVRVTNVSRFCGAKSSISFSEKNGFKRANGVQDDGFFHPNAPSYGQWITRPVDMSFHPMPKRLCVNPDGFTLRLRSFSNDSTSLPYSRALGRMSEEAMMLRAAFEEIMEQPDGDLSDYELEDGGN